MVNVSSMYICFLSKIVSVSGEPRVTARHSRGRSPLLLDDSSFTGKVVGASFTEANAAAIGLGAL